MTQTDAVAQSPRVSVAKPISSNARGAGFAGTLGGTPWGQERSDWGAP
jgi:hypothetical protein